VGNTKIGASNPLTSWGCRGEHMFENCPNKNKALHNIQEATIVNNAACTICKIYASLEDFQADHQFAVIEL
jgi:hypothetical protein